MDSPFFRRPLVPRKVLLCHTAPVARVAELAARYWSCDEIAILGRALAEAALRQVLPQAGEYYSYGDGALTADGLSPALLAELRARQFDLIVLPTNNVDGNGYDAWRTTLRQAGGRAVLEVRRDEQLLRLEPPPAPPGRVTGYEARYAAGVADRETARAAVGGQFEAVGARIAELLVSHGLRPDHRFLDFGCGCGRLQVALGDYFHAPGGYYGCDVAGQLLRFGREIYREYYPHPAPARTVKTGSDSALPFAAAAFDYIALVSVFTHLEDEDIYRSLREIRRVLVPGGRCLITFFDAATPYGWQSFAQSAALPPARRQLRRPITVQHPSFYRILFQHLGLREVEFIPALPAGTEHPQQSRFLITRDCDAH